MNNISNSDKEHGRRAVKVTVCVIAVLIIAAACSHKACGCSPPPPSQAVVWGQVTLDTGGPAPRAAMTAFATPLGILCVQDTMYNWGSADSLGRYRLSVFGAQIADSGCVFVGARFPPQGSVTHDTVLGPFKLRFRMELPFDSMNVNIVVKH